MTLLLSAVVGTDVHLATDSFQGAKGSKPILAEKVLCWLDSAVVLTGFGDFCPPPTALRHRPGTERELGACRNATERSETVRRALHPIVVRRGSSATCVLFDRAGELTVITRLDRASGQEAWRVSGRLGATWVAGNLRAIGLPSQPDLSCHGEVFANERAFRLWATDRLGAATMWCLQNEPSMPTVQPPFYFYVVTSRDRLGAA